MAREPEMQAEPQRHVRVLSLGCWHGIIALALKDMLPISGGSVGQGWAVAMQ